VGWQAIGGGHLPRLEDLDLSANRIGVDGATALAEAFKVG
jgi:hypothetical protein